MCGLYGWMLEGTLPANMDKVAESLETDMVSRGGHSVGIYAAHLPKQGNEFYFRKVTDSAGPVVRHAARYPLVIGHTRFATSGAIKKRNAHPFRCGSVVFAHNGWAYIPKKVEDARPGVEVDSEHIARHLQEGRPLSELSAHGTGVWVKNGGVYVAQFCDDASLCLVHLDGKATTCRGYLWASTTGAIIKVLGLLGLKGKGEGKGWRDITWKEFRGRGVYRLRFSKHERVDMPLPQDDLCYTYTSRASVGRDSWNGGYGDTWADAYRYRKGITYYPGTANGGGVSKQLSLGTGEYIGPGAVWHIRKDDPYWVEITYPGSRFKTTHLIRSTTFEAALERKGDVESLNRFYAEYEEADKARKVLDAKDAARRLGLDDDTGRFVLALKKCADCVQRWELPTGELLTSAQLADRIERGSKGIRNEVLERAGVPKELLPVRLPDTEGKVPYGSD